ncbi:MAG: MotA/TolQ/ExbB proton channel family protein [Methanosphaera stadtmanae]|jgi:biopolymer transport protein ExbB/TolQ|nr:MotA/TolQ/ExbB proton channel family protein [Methanosphaera stadtmanae]
MAAITASGILTTIINVIAESLIIPVLILLVIFILLVLIQLGGVLAEYSHRVKLSDKELDNIINSINDSENSEQIIKIINESKLNNNIKKILIKITNIDNLKPNTKEAYIRKIIENEEYKYAQTLRKTEIITRVSSGCGLLGTLIPLGPGLASLGTGDIATLSSQLIIAFNTTTVGLTCSLVSYVISKIRKMWYNNDISLIYTISEAILEAKND